MCIIFLFNVYCFFIYYFCSLILNIKLDAIVFFFICSSRPVRFGIGHSGAPENKENARPYIIREDNNDSDQSDGPFLYRDNDPDHETKVARKESLSLKLALRPNVDELVNRNILHMQSENERQESKEAIGARLIRRLSMRPTPEELIERNILKSSKIF